MSGNPGNVSSLSVFDMFVSYSHHIPRLLVASVRIGYHVQCLYVDADMCDTEGAISNPNNSEEAKQRAQDRLSQMEQSGEANSAEAHAGQVERGHKVRSFPPSV